MESVDLNLFWHEHLARHHGRDARVTLTNEFITGTVDGKNEPRLLRIWFQLLPEMDDVRVDGACVWVVLVTPDCIEQTIAAERLSRIGDKVSQQREFFRGQIHNLAGAS